jgi:uncharacterized protein (TIGR02246 family)
MRGMILPAALTVALAGLLGYAATGKRAGAQDTSGGAREAATSADDQQAIRRTVAGLAAAFNKGDLPGLTGVWVPDAEYIDEAGAVTRGRGAIATRFRSYLADHKGAHMVLKVMNVRLLKRDVALQDGSMALTGPDGSTNRSRFTAVWLKEDGKWRIGSVRDLPEADEEAGGAPLKELQWLVGDWKGEKGGANVSIRWALNRKFLDVTFTTRQRNGELMVRQLIGQDPLTGQVKSWTFDSSGGYGEGLWEREGNSWVIEVAAVLPDGQTGSAVNVIRYVDDGTFVFQARDRQVGGEPVPDNEVKLIRKAAAK